MKVDGTDSDHVHWRA